MAVSHAGFQRATSEHVRPDLLSRNASQFHKQHDPMRRYALPLCHGLTARANARSERPGAARFQNQFFGGFLVHGVIRSIPYELLQRRVACKIVINRLQLAVDSNGVLHVGSSHHRRRRSLKGPLRVDGSPAG